MLRVLASNLDYKGDAIGLASAWEMVSSCTITECFCPCFIACRFARPKEFPWKSTLNYWVSRARSYENGCARISSSGNYQETSAPLELWAGGIQQIAQHAQDSHIHAEFPQLAARLFQRAMDAGYGREEVSALFKVL